MRTKVLFVTLAFATACFGKDIKTVVLKTQPEMHCTGCEKKIKDNIRFEKGIKSITTNLDNKNVENIIAGFKKIKYEASEATPTPAGKKDCCGGEKKHEGCGDKKE